MPPMAPMVPVLCALYCHPCHHYQPLSNSWIAALPGLRLSLLACFLFPTWIQKDLPVKWQRADATNKPPDQSHCAATFTAYSKVNSVSAVGDIVGLIQLLGWSPKCNCCCAFTHEQSFLWNTAKREWMRVIQAWIQCQSQQHTFPFNNLVEYMPEVSLWQPVSHDMTGHRLCAFCCCNKQRASHPGTFPSL